jgi:predicted nucleic acid-binding protein
MTIRPFLDTNVLVYTYTLDDSRNEKAAALLASGGVVSIQVLNEFVDVVRRKLRFNWDTTLQALDELKLLLDPPLPLTVDVHRCAMDISNRYGFRIYDSLIIGAAKLAGCKVLYTEELHDGQTIEGVLVRDPFRRA